MDQLLFMLVDVMPEDMLLEKVEDSIKEYKIVRTEENRRQMEMNMGMLQIKYSIETEGGIEKLRKKMMTIKQGVELLTPKEQ